MEGERESKEISKWKKVKKRKKLAERERKAARATDRMTETKTEKAERHGRER